MKKENLREVLLQICTNTGYKISKNFSGITLEMLIDGYLAGNVVIYVRDKTGCAKQTVTNAIKNTFTDKETGNFSTIQWLLSKVGCKHCASCGTIKPLEDFYPNASKYDGYGDYCSACSRAARIATYNKDPSKELAKNTTRKRLVSEKQTPSWADQDKILEIYRNRPEGYHVDHILPLNGKLVCGLHVENNLQYLTVEENLRKKNKFTP